MNDRSTPEGAPETPAMTSTETLPHPGDFDVFRRTPPRTFENVDLMLRQRNYGSRKSDLHCRVCGCFHNVVIDRCCCESL
jgi:hypothetical protein